MTLYRQMRYLIAAAPHGGTMVQVEFNYSDDMGADCTAWETVFCGGLSDCLNYVMTNIINVPNSKDEAIAGRPSIGEV